MVLDRTQERVDIFAAINEVYMYDSSTITNDVANYLIDSIYKNGSLIILDIKR